MSTTFRVPEQMLTPAPGSLQRVFSFPVVQASLLVVLAIATVRGRFDDPDMWWHMRMGEVMWTTHTVPTTDVFSYTTNHHAYVPHEWLPQILIYAAYRWGGYCGLMLWLCIFTSAILIAGYALCSIYSSNVKAGFLGALAIWVFGTSGFSIRTQMVGYLLLTVEMLVLQLGKTRSARWFLALPPLFALWVNCHGSFFLGIVVALVFLLASYLTFHVGSLESRRWEPCRRRMLAAALLLSCMALFLNPEGIQAIGYPLNMMFVQSTATRVISEWMPLAFNQGRGLALLGVLAVIFLLSAARRTPLFLHEILLLALGTWLAASHRRMVFPFGILAAPVLARVLSSVWDGYDSRQDRRWANAACIAVSIMFAVLCFPGTQNLRAQVEEHSPVRAVEFIKGHRLQGPMLNDFDDGGYLIWAAPEYPDFIDGRADVFDWTGVLAEFERWITLQSPPQTLLDKYHVNFCLLERNSPMAEAMSLLPGWKLVYSDNRSAVFQRIPGPASQS